MTYVLPDYELQQKSRTVQKSFYGADKAFFCAPDLAVVPRTPPPRALCVSACRLTRGTRYAVTTFYGIFDDAFWPRTS